MGVLQHEQIGSIADGTKHGVRAGSEAHPGQYTLSRAHLHFVSVFLFFFSGDGESLGQSLRGRWASPYRSQAPQRSCDCRKLTYDPL